MNFDFHNPTKLITGKDCIKTNAQIFKSLGSKAIIVTGATSAEKSGALADITTALKENGIGWLIENNVKPNPLLLDAYKSGTVARKENADFVIGIGGGSPIDAAKAIAVFATNPTLAMEDIFKLDWKNKALPIVAVGTTAGTGTEVNSFSILSDVNGRKKSIAHIDCYPTVSFGDYKYTLSLPIDFTVSTALDALSHALEAYFNRSANNVSDIFSLEAIKVLHKALAELEKANTGDGITESLRESLYYASVMAGYALGMCGTVYCHTLGYFLTEEHNVAHGQACAVFLPSFIDRHAKLVPDKTKRLEREMGADISELKENIEKLLIQNNYRLDESRIKELVEEKKETKNFTKTMPSGLSADEAVEIMKALFI